MILGLDFDRFREFVTGCVSFDQEAEDCPDTHIASSNFFSANALFPSAFNASAMMMMI